MRSAPVRSDGGPAQRSVAAEVGLDDGVVLGQLLGPAWVEGMFGVDEGCDAAGLLSLGNHMEGEGRFAGRFRSKNLDDAKPQT